MTTTTDLTMERLEALETDAAVRWAAGGDNDPVLEKLIAMAKRTLAAEEAVRYLQGEHEDAVCWQRKAEQAEQRVRELADEMAGHIDRAHDLEVLLEDWLGEATEYYDPELLARTETALMQSSDAGGAE